MASIRQELQRRIRSLDDVAEGESSFGAGDAYWVDAKEIAHFEDEHVLDLRLTRDVVRRLRGELRADPRVQLRSGTSDWITLTVAGRRDIPFALRLVELAVDAHRPASGRPRRPPPGGGALARRKRFH